MANNLDFRVKNGLAVTTTATVEGATQSTSTNTGALQVQGGTGIAKDLFVGGSINVAQTLLVTNTATFSGAAIYNGSVRVNPATSSTTTGTGALVVVGGVGIGGTLNVGGDFNVGGIIYGTIIGNISTASHITGGTLGQVPYQTAPGRTSFYGPGTLGQLLVSGGTAAPVYTNTASIYVGRATLADSATAVVGGSLGTLVYQTGSGATGFVSVGTAGQLLMSAGAAVPVYTNTASIYVGRATLADSVTTVAITNDVATATPQYITFVSTSTGNAGLKTAATTGMVYIPSTGYVGIGVSPSSGAKLQVTGYTDFWNATNTLLRVQHDGTNSTLQSFTSGAAGNINLNPSGGNVGIGIAIPISTLHVAGTARFTGITTVTNATNATSSVTGAFQVAGGVGITSDLYVGGNETITGDLAVNGGDITSSAATFNLLNATVTTLNLAQAGTAISIGALTGTTTVRNNLTVSGNFVVQGVTTTVDSTVTNVADPIMTLGGGPGGIAPTVDDNRDRGIAFQWHSGVNARTGFMGYDDSTGFFTFLTSATIVNEVVAAAGGTTHGALDADLAGGTAQSIHYQSAPNVTSFLPASTIGYVLQTNGTGSIPSWVSPTGLSAGSAAQLSTIAATANATYYPTFVDSNNTTALAESYYTTSSFSINPSTGNVGIGTASPTVRLEVAKPGAQVIVKFAAGTNKQANFQFTDTADGAGGNGFAFGHDYNNNGGHDFFIYDNENAANRLYIDTSGNVGIGTTIPTATLHLDPINGFPHIQLDSNGLTYDSGIIFAVNGTKKWVVGMAQSVTSGQFEIRDDVAAADRLVIDTTGNVGIGTTTPSYKLQVAGSFAATTKSFVIDHPTKPNMQLRYGSLESPYHGVRLTGEATLVNGTCTVKLPDYLHGLCKQEGSQVQITNIRHGKVIWVEEVNVDKDEFTVKCDVKKTDKKDYSFYWSFTGIRKDVEDMVVEF
jgi:hypothetical protein